MLGPGRTRQKLEGTLQAAYADGLLSAKTLAHRLDLLLASPVVDPAQLIGDLPRRAAGWKGLAARSRQLFSRRRRSRRGILLALDWSGSSRGEMMIGRHPSCDVRLAEATVSRRHARLVFRDGGWIVQDLGSTNGTAVNGVKVGRCRVRPGDRLLVGDQLLRVD